MLTLSCVSPRRLLSVRLLRNCLREVSKTNKGRTGKAAAPFLYKGYMATLLRFKARPRHESTPPARITARVPDTVLEWLYEASAISGCSTAHIIRNALRAFMKRHTTTPAPRLRALIMAKRIKRDKLHTAATCDVDITIGMHEAKWLHECATRCDCKPFHIIHAALLYHYETFTRVMHNQAPAITIKVSGSPTDTTPTRGNFLGKVINALCSIQLHNGKGNTIIIEPASPLDHTQYK